MSEKRVSDRDRRRLFADYCLHSYFLADPHSYCYARDIFQRHTGRTLVYSFEVTPNARETLVGHVDHLACHYFRFYTAPDVRAVEFLWVRNPHHLDATVAASTPDLRRGNTQSVPQGQPLSVAPAGADHLVLVVSNSSPDKDALNYSILLSAK